jgi:hypothetical protein
MKSTGNTLNKNIEHKIWNKQIHNEKILEE